LGVNNWQNLRPTAIEKYSFGNDLAPVLNDLILSIDHRLDDDYHQLPALNNQAGAIKT
jgi:hypothetical protein